DGEIVDKIIQAIKRADRIIQNLLDASRAGAGQPMNLVYREGDLGVEIAEVVKDLVLQYGDRFRFEARGDLVGVWAADVLRRVLENLAINAVKYGANDQPVQIQLTRNGDTIVLSVENEGNPISLEEQQALFQLFKRGKPAEINGVPGWGLGLSVVLAAAHALHGHVDVESGPSIGTTFRLEFPKENPS
ncbi:MAG: histidine kinase, partial [Bdellovibrio sp.]